MNNFKDIEKKLDYYKQQILLEFVKKGIYPDDILIESRLKSLDANLALFKNYNAVTGFTFDVNQYNERLKLIYKDLEILYELLHELTVIEYNKLQGFITSYLSELNSIVETYNKRAEYENNSTTLGKTLLFKNNALSIDNEDSITTINLGELDIPNAAVLACIANINNVLASDIIFKFRRLGTTEWINASPYNHNNDIITMPGELKKNLHNYSIQEDQKVNGPLLIDLDTNIEIKNKYDILGGYNKVFVTNKDNNGFTIEERPLTVDSLAFNKKGYINFYVVGGNSISFKFNKKPIATNFPVDSQRVDDLKYIHHFFMEFDDNFAFQFELDKGAVYAIKETGLISNNKLYYSGSNKVSDFLIIETATGDKNKYEVKLEAYNNNDDIDVDSIIIKQLE